MKISLIKRTLAAVLLAAVCAAAFVLGLGGDVRTENIRR